MTLRNVLTSTVRVDVRLCGSIPRKDMDSENNQVLENRQGALCLSHLAEGSHANGPVCENPTPTLMNNHHICDGLAGILSNHLSLNVVDDDQSSVPNIEKTTRTSLLPNFALTPIMEPPSWAVPARGEASLEVRLW
jgi:hypothetical protein